MKYTLIDDTLKFYNSLITDIESAQKSVIIEVYRFDNHFIGQKVLSALIAKAKEGVDVYVLLDSWGFAKFGRVFRRISKVWWESSLF